MAVSYPDTPGVSRYFDIWIRIAHHYFKFSFISHVFNSFQCGISNLQCTNNVNILSLKVITDGTTFK